MVTYDDVGAICFVGSEKVFRVTWNKNILYLQFGYYIVKAKSAYDDVSNILIQSGGSVAEERSFERLMFRISVTACICDIHLC